MVYLSWPPEGWSQKQIKNALGTVDPNGLFKQPLLLMSGMREMKLSQAEVENLRKYLVDKGGFLFIDDYSDGNDAFASSVRGMLRYVLPDYPVKIIPNDHEIYRIFYEMGGPPLGSIDCLQRRGRDVDATNYLEGVFIGDRLAVIISDRDYWNALIGREPYAPGVVRFCTNMLVYAVTRGKISDYSQYKP